MENVKRLVSICGMLGSDSENERSVAALHATTLIKKMGKTWEEVIHHGIKSKPQRAFRSDEPHRQQSHHKRGSPGGRMTIHKGIECAALMTVLQHYIAETNQLTQREINFIRSLDDQGCARMGLTAGQWRWALSIVNRMQSETYA